MFKNMQIGQTIAEQRRRMGLTQTELANQLGLSPQAVSKWENGLGSPDISLLPEIAQILNLSMDQLFGLEAVETAPGMASEGANGPDSAEGPEAEERKSFDFPERYESLPLVAVYRDRACYSDLELVRQEEGHVYFVNGSEADLRENLIINRDRSQILIVFYEEMAQKSRAEEKEERDLGDEEAIRRLDVDVKGNCDLYIRRTNSAKFSWRAVGDDRFIRSVSAHQEGDCLSLRVERDKQKRSFNLFSFSILSNLDNRIYIDCPTEELASLLLKASGACEVHVEPAFGRAEIRSAGAAEVDMNRVDELELSIAGAGECKVGSCQNADVRIAGAGDVTIDRLNGDRLQISIAGAGDCKIGQGEVKELQCVLNGAGDVDASHLTVNDAEIKMNGFGDVVIGRVKGRSVEQVSIGSSLRILERG